MPMVPVYTMDGGTAGEIELNDAIFGIKPFCTPQL
jgi:ribosomal protein L4